MASINRFSPIQLGSGDPSPDNVRPILPAVSIAGGKNLLKLDQSLIRGNSAFFDFEKTDTGVIINDKNPNGGYLVCVKPNTTYTFSYNAEYTGSNMHIRVWKGTTTETFIVNTPNANKATFTTDFETNYVICGFYAYSYGLNQTISNMQLEEGSFKTEYEPYQQLDLYGGYLDIINSKIVEEQTYTIINNLTGAITSYNDNNRIVYSFQNLPYKPKNSSTANLKCSYFKSSTTQVTWTAFIGSTGNFLVYIPTAFETAKSWKEYTIDNPLEICYELNVPIIHYLTVTQMAQAMAQLNINKSSLIESRRKILLNSPHIMTLTGLNALFKTDLKAPIKSLKVNFSPIQSGTGDPSSTNIRPITGWTEINVKHRQGLWDGKYEKGVLNSSGVEVASNDRYRNVDYISVFPSKKIIFKYKQTAPSMANIYVCEYNQNKEFVTSYWQVNSTHILNSSTYYIRFFMDTAFSNSYVDGNLSITYTPDSSDDILISFGANETIYGGYVDLISGILVATHKSVIFDGTESGWETYKSSQQIHFCKTIPDKKIGLRTSISSLFPNAGNIAFWDYIEYSKYGDHHTLDRIYVNAPYEMPNGVSEWRSWLSKNPMQLVYQLATPITYQLTPQQLKTFIGQNDIFANATDNIEVEYWSH